MKSPKTFPSAPNQAASKPRHSSLLLWTVLIMVMLSGLMYLGSRVKEQRMAKSTTPSNPSQNNPLQDLPETTKATPQKSAPQTFESILATLKSQQLINPVVYKTSLILKSDAASSDTQNQDALWQSGQHQLSLIKATVHAGIDLSELTVQSLSTKSPATIHLPPARISHTQINNVTMYDVKTGLPSTVQMGLSMTSDQEKNIKAQVEREFCQSEVLQAATEDTRQHVIALLDAMKITMVVRVSEPVGCQQAAS
ncbi:MAG: hypothetical protein NVS3B3_24250 [Aquirhabdus sp.]